MQTRCVVLATFVASVLGASAASANGRFPRAEHLIEDPADPKRLIVAATFGMLSTSDGGKNWYYTCEEAFSFIPSVLNGGFGGDPVMALMPDGSLLAGVGERVTLSPDRGCQWKTVLDVAPLMNVEDLAVAPSNRNIVVALVKSIVDGGLVHQLQQSTDGGANWKAIGTPLPIAIGYTLDVDPKDPMHIYATGVTSTKDDPDTGVLLSSVDLGATWTSRPIPKTNIMAAPYIAALHPADGNKVFVRTDEWPEIMGTYNAADALWYTADAGQTWTELLRPQTPAPEFIGAKLFAFALSPDGSTLLAGFGDPVEGGGRIVEPSLMGIYTSTAPNYSFGANPMPIYADSISCLQWTAKGIYFCGAPQGAPQGNVSYVGFAPDISMLSPSTATVIMRSSEIKGEPPCCSGRSVSTCDWSNDCVDLKACAPDDGGMSIPDAAACVFSDAGGDTGRPDAGVGDGGAADASSAGRGGSTGGSGGSSAGTEGTGATPSKGCDCRMSRRAGPRSGNAFALLLLAFAARRRSRPCPPSGLGRRSRSRRLG